MSNIGTHFRTVALGGFHKQDVLDYITAASREYQEQTTGLRQEAEQARQERAEMAEKLESAESARQKNASECERLSELLAQRTSALEQAERDLTALKAEHEELLARTAGLEEKLPHLEAGAAAYSALKDRLATIELEAHRKAKETAEKAENDAAKVREEAENTAARLHSDLEGWLNRVQSGYQRMRTDISATVSHLTSELERGKAALEETGGSFQQYDEALNELLHCERKPEGVPAPEPLPLEEEIAEEREEGNCNV